MDLYSSLLNKLLLYRSQPGQQTEKEASPSGPMKTLLLRWLHHDVNELKEMFLILAQNLPLTNFVAHSNLFPGFFILFSYFRARFKIAMVKNVMTVWSIFHLRLWVFLRVEKGLKVALEASIGSEHCCLRAKISFPAVSASGCGAEEVFITLQK
ncbi:hypothetical protein D5086_022884 [Populus alba]|uniref:Uncharacterized protein n=1 Tax=Populus alba TaxID=43335 RepID=A0ACC4B870_POPAL